MIAGAFAAFLPPLGARSLARGRDQPGPARRQRARLPHRRVLSSFMPLVVALARGGGARRQRRTRVRVHGVDPVPRAHPRHLVAGPHRARRDRRHGHRRGALGFGDPRRRGRPAAVPGIRPFLEQPAAWTVPLAVLVTVLVSRTDRRGCPRHGCVPHTPARARADGRSPPPHRGPTDLRPVRRLLVRPRPRRRRRPARGRIDGSISAGPDPVAPARRWASAPPPGAHRRLHSSTMTEYTRLNRAPPPHEPSARGCRARGCPRTSLQASRIGARQPGVARVGLQLLTPPEPPCRTRARAGAASPRGSPAVPQTRGA